MKVFGIYSNSLEIINHHSFTNSGFSYWNLDEETDYIFRRKCVGSVKVKSAFKQDLHHKYVECIMYMLTDFFGQKKLWQFTGYILNSGV